MQSEGERGDERGWLSDPSFPPLSPLGRRGRARYAEFGKGRNGTREGGAEVTVCCQEEGRFSSPGRDEGCLSTWLTA